MAVRYKRVYEPPSEEDGDRILVDRLWPRGLSKHAARLDGWDEEIAPSPALRKWFGHDPARFAEFKRRYFAELAHQPERVSDLLTRARNGTITLLFAAKDSEHNNAVALSEYLERRLRR